MISSSQGSGASGERHASRRSQLRPLPAQPAFRRRRFAPWQPGADSEPLEPWDRAAYPEAARLLESSIVLGTADEPLFVQPAELMEHYLEAFEKVIEEIEIVLRAPYWPVEPWPPREPPP